MSNNPPAKTHIPDNTVVPRGTVLPDGYTLGWNVTIEGKVALEYATVDIPDAGPVMFIRRRYGARALLIWGNVTTTSAFYMWSKRQPDLYKQIDKRIRAALRKLRAEGRL